MRGWSRQAGSLRLRLLLAVTGCVVAVSAVALAIDLHREYRSGVARITTSLKEQANALRAAHALIADPEAFRRYVEQFCATMDAGISPGHGIIVVGPGGDVVARSSHLNVPVDEEQTLLRGPDGSPVSTPGSHRLVGVRLKDSDGRTFILAQYLDHIEGQLRGRIVLRAVWVVVTAGATIVSIYVATTRWVIAPLDVLVRAARQWGARDFSSRARVSGPSDLRTVADEFNSMAGQLETHEHRRLLELEQAREIQSNLLPRFPSECAGLALAAEYEPAGQVAGDLYDVFELPGDRIVVAIFDVSGHGLSAAMLTGVVKMSLRRRLTDGVDLSTAMRNVNLDIGVCTTDSYFVTGCVGIWDPPSGRWTYCAAGHPGGVLVRDGKTLELPSTAPLLGVLPDGRWNTRSVVLLPHDRIFLYTDGIIEACVDDKQFGLTGMCSRLEQTTDLDLHGQAKAVMGALDPPGGGSGTDDMTVVALEVRRLVPSRVAVIP